MEHRNYNRRAFNQSAGGLALLVGSRLACGQEAPSTSTGQVAVGTKGVAATVHPLATNAAVRALEEGGNAFDAAVAASLMLSVVDGFNSGIGGGCLAMLRTADGSIHALDGREKAPAKAAPEMFYRDGKPDPQLSQVGPLASGVPGLLAVLSDVSKRYGNQDWNTALTRAANVAEQGFVLDSNYVGRLRGAARLLRRFPESARILLDSSGEPWSVGHRLRQPDLARTLRQLDSQGIDWFYRGEFAELTEKFMREQNGMLTAGDFANYQMKERKPIRASYRGQTVFGFPPPSSGGIHVAQMLGMLTPHNVADLFGESETIGRHLLLEVMKRAMADRAHWLGDADFAKVPKGLLDPAYLQKRAADISLDQSMAVTSHGQPPRADVDLFGRGGHTTHLVTADAAGNVVSLTQTINTTFGSKMIVPGTGVVLNNELDDFSIAPGVRNAFGLLGSEANLIAPGKRPLSSMSPTIVLDAAGLPRMACGAAGGPKIITTVLQVLVRVLDLGESIEQAIGAPRTHHQWSPNEAVCEEALPERVVKALASKGHAIKSIRSAAVSQGLEFSNKSMRVASDPRVPSSAQGL